MNDYVWNFPSELPAVSDDMQASPTDIGWGDYKTFLSGTEDSNSSEKDS